MHALVTGGAGFIGSNLTRLLLEGKHDVTILDNFSSGYRENLRMLAGARVIEGDVRDAAAVEHATRNAEVVFHLAASVGHTRSIEHPVHDAEVNVVGTIQVLEAARRAGARTVVFSSSAAIFGNTVHLPIREDHPAEPRSPYGATKLCAEKLCLAYATLHPLNVICLRYFNVYGVGQRDDRYGNVVPIFIHRVLHGEPLLIFGDGEQTRDFVNVRDIARANYLAGMPGIASGVFNIGSGAGTTINQLAAMVQDAAGVPRRTEHGPERAGDVQDCVADISGAMQGLNFTPTVELGDGLAEYLAWSRAAMTQ